MQKRGVRSRGLSAMAEGASEIPNGGMSEDSACGHGSCGTNCKVRYVGPTSSMRDHHILHAARGVTHMWSAAVISGLAVVVTGVFIYSSAQAREVASARVARPASEYQQLLDRMEKMEQKMEEVRLTCVNALDPQSLSASTTESNDEAVE